MVLLGRAVVSLGEWERTVVELVIDNFLRGMGRTVDVSSTAGVVAGEDGVELHDTIRVGLLDTAEESGVQVGAVAGVTVAGGSHARVDTLYI